MAGERDALVVFLPGMFCGAWFWRYFCRVSEFEGGLLQELPGLYGPGKPLLTFGAEVEAYGRLIREAAGERRVVIVGHSYGAQHALALARDKTLRVEKLVLVAPALGRWWMVGAFRKVLWQMMLGRGFRAAFLAGDDEKITGKLPMPLANERVAGIELRHAAAQVLAVVLRLGRALNLRDDDVPVTVIVPESDGLLANGLVKGAVRVRGGHFRFLGQREVWEIIRQGI